MAPAWASSTTGGRSVPRADLVGRGAGATAEGPSVALSGDGRTALVGAPGADASFVFVRRGFGWRQQAKLVGTGELVGAGGPTFGAAKQGTSVALSGNGDIALVGGPADDSLPGGGRSCCGGVGATWVFVRTGLVWRQQAKLVARGSEAYAQGVSVAISAKGTTAVIGGGGTDWVFVHSGSSWHQQATLVPSGINVSPSVAVSANGNETLIGDNNRPRTFVFTRAGAGWRETATLVGYLGPARGSQGMVALSGDGRTALIDGWLFTRTGRGWHQRARLMGSGEDPNAQLISGALSARGTTALILCPPIATRHKAGAWVFTRSGSGWHQVGSKLVAGSAADVFYWSGALSGDGSTALVGSTALGKDPRGGAWVFSLL